MNSPEQVLIVGASDKPERYAHKAMHALLRHGHEVVLVHPRLKEIEGRAVLADVAQVGKGVSTVTMYVGPSISAGMAGKLIALKPRRVIFNPGAENDDLSLQLEGAGIAVENACTLVLLASGQF